MISTSTRTLLTQDLLPTVVVFAVIVWVLVGYARRTRRAGLVPGGARRSPAPGGARRSPAPRRDSVAGSIAGGYLVFAALTAGISLAAGESASYIGKALLGGAILAFAIVAPLAALAVAIARRRSMP